MATQAIEQAPDDAVATPAKGKNAVMIMAAAGVLAGVAAGLFGLAPLLAPHKSASATDAAKAAEPTASSVTHSVENLVLNPAGSNGARFLMVTATFELKDAATEAKLKEHEPEVRDNILAVLGKKTVDELADMSQRDKIKVEVQAAVAPLFPKGSIRRVFFPQFVIQ